MTVSRRLSTRQFATACVACHGFLLSSRTSPASPALDKHQIASYEPTRNGTIISPLLDTHYWCCAKFAAPLRCLL
jgi:hypothetical protein